MFAYHSVQSHSEFNKGEGRTKVTEVHIKGARGHKSVTVRNRAGKKIKSSKKRLTRKEVNCIKRCQFIPGLFKDCEKCISK